MPSWPLWCWKPRYNSQSWRALFSLNLQFCSPWAMSLSNINCCPSALINILPMWTTARLIREPVICSHLVLTSRGVQKAIDHLVSFKSSGKLKDRSRSGWAQNLYFFIFFLRSNKELHKGPKYLSVVPAVNRPQTEGSQRPECRVIKKHFLWSLGKVGSTERAIISDPPMVRWAVT